MQYPFAVTFEDTDASHQYVVRANDSRQAVRRAARRYLGDIRRPAPESPSSVLNLTPKQEGDDAFLPRIDGQLLDMAARPTEAAAVSASLAYYRSGRSR